jgi:L-Ala-D/L-Glu epimerase
MTTHPAICQHPPMTPPPLQFTCTHESWPIAGTFTIARGSKTAADVVVVRLSRGGVAGQGECVPYARYGETVPQVLAALNAAKSEIERRPSVVKLWDMDMPKAALNALDCALWDLECKGSNLSAMHIASTAYGVFVRGLQRKYNLLDEAVEAESSIRNYLGYDAQPRELVTAYTLSLDTPDAMAAAAKAASARPLLKLKLGKDGDEQRLAAIREAVPNARLIVDANEGWSPDVLPRMLAACETYNVELVEQPLPAGDDEALRGLPRKTVICADESAHGIESLAALKGKYDAVNIKLDKTGGLTPALAMAHEAQAQGFKIMVGCMLATSLAMAPAFVVAQMADYVDLDGPLLLAKDREPAITYKGSLMQPPPRALWG